MVLEGDPKETPQTLTHRLRREQGEVTAVTSLVTCGHPGRGLQPFVPF